MDGQKRSLRMGAAVIVLAVVLRLWSGGAFGALGALFREPAVASFLLYLETGRVFRPAPTETAPPQTTAATETVPETSEATVPPPAFTAEDADLVSVRNESGVTVDVAACLETPLGMGLNGALLLHTHATESYTQSGETPYEESAAYRTLDSAYNMIAIGRRVEALLVQGGMTAARSETLHDYPSYNGAYDNSRVTAQALQSENPGISLILDLHRDASVDASGTQLDTWAQVNGAESAQLMFVVGTGNPNWQENLVLAVHLTAQLEKMHPGITRGIVLRPYVYNQDLSPGALLVEVGAAGNTQAEALAACDALAQAILTLAGRI